MKDIVCVRHAIFPSLPWQSPATCKTHKANVNSCHENKVSQFSSWRENAQICDAFVEQRPTRVVYIFHTLQ